MTWPQLATILLLNITAILITAVVIVIVERYKSQRQKRFDCNLVTAVTKSVYLAVQGRRLNSYLDADRLLGTPKHLAVVSRQLVRQIERLQKGLKICFVEGESGPMGMLTLAGHIAVQANRPVSVVRIKRDVSAMAFEGGELYPGDRCVVVLDILSTGTQLHEAARRIERDRGACVVAAICLSDRRDDQSAHPGVAESGIQVISLSQYDVINEIFENPKKRGRQTVEVAI